MPCPAVHQTTTASPPPCCHNGRLRASLGLKPLNLEAPKQRAASDAARAQQQQQAAAEAKPDADAIRAKLAE